MDYPVEVFTDEERERLAPHFTNLDRPVFALVNLPETVKGALFARYSRYPGTLRRLFLDEFAGDMDDATARTFDGAEGQRAADLYRRIFLGYGDDSVAQLGGAHIAIEWASNVLTKVLQRGRLAAYLEQSTRYIAYDSPMPGGGYRYWRDPALGPQYERAMDALFETYAASLPRVEAWADSRFPRAEGEPESAHRRSIRAKALDLLRGLLPAASLSHVGVFASGQAYEQLILRLMASPLPRPARSARWCCASSRRSCRASSRASTVPTAAASGSTTSPVAATPPRGSRHGWGSTARARSTAAARRSASSRCTGARRTCLRRCCSRRRRARRKRCARPFACCRPTSARPLIAELVGERANRRHRPGRGFEAVRYRFEVVSDYGAFRDLQRHRMLTIEWQPLTPHLGAGIPAELDDAGVAGDYRSALETSRSEYERLMGEGLPSLAPYALCLGFRIRYVLDMNAREAMHLIELRSGREGHPSYRAVAHELHAQIAEVHPSVGAAMKYVDHDTEPRLERILSEIRTHARRAQAV